MSIARASTFCDMMVPFVECLTVRNWCVAIFPHLVWRRVCGRGLADHCHVIDGSRLAMAVARAEGWLIGVNVKPLDFRLVEVREEDGTWTWLKIVYEDLAAVQADAMGEPEFRHFIGARLDGTRLRTYLAKALASVDVAYGGGLSSTLRMIRICPWILKHRGPSGAVPLLFVERRVWQRALARYASRFGVVVVHVPARFDPRDWLRRRVPPGLKAMLRRLRIRWYTRSRRTLEVVTPMWRQPVSAQRVCVEYTGHLNLNRPECYSDLFFWQQSALSRSAGEIVMTFNLASYPLTEPMWTELTTHGIEAVALDPRATAVLGAAVFRPRVRRARAADDLSGVQTRSRSAETVWLHERMATYRQLRDDWADFCSTYGIKVYLTWFKYNEWHCAIADALQQLGGVTAIYQRAYEELPTAQTIVHADIVFGFSQATAEVERRSHSVIPYHVTVGYPGDHRFPRLREQAGQIRQALQHHGAQRILAFADETSFDNPRLFLDNRSQQEHYQFLLEKLLQEPWLGLVFKPKSPASLQRRLGPVADLLRRAEATGRCYVFKEGRLQGSYPPAAAALAADVAIHGHLFSGTAGLEAALAGVPTLLLDREGWPASALYRLGVGRVVFTNWDALWKACMEHWAWPGGVPDFGEWSPLLDELDPFRDGRAAERIGTYIQWLLAGFKAGLPRETVMADAAERYGVLWGRKYITHVNTEPAAPDHALAQAHAA